MGRHGCYLRFLAWFTRRRSPLQVGFAQNNPHHHLDVWEHVLLAVDASAARGSGIAVRLAALLHDVAKPETYSEERLADGELRGHPIILLLNGVPGDDRRTGARHESAEKHVEPACGRECGHTTEEAFSALPLLYDGTYIRYSGCQTAAAILLSISSCDMTSPAPSREAVAITAAAT